MEHICLSVHITLNKTYYAPILWSSSIPLKMTNKLFPILYYSQYNQTTSNNFKTLLLYQSKWSGTVSCTVLPGSKTGVIVITQIQTLKWQTSQPPTYKYVSPKSNHRTVYT